MFAICAVIGKRAIGEGTSATGAFSMTGLVLSGLLLYGSASSGDQTACQATPLARHFLAAAHAGDTQEISELRKASLNCPDSNRKIGNAFFLAMLIVEPTLQEKAFIRNFPRNGQEYWLQFNAFAPDDAWFGYHHLWSAAGAGNEEAIGKSMDGLATSDGAFAEGFEYSLERAFERHPRAVVSVLADRSAESRRLVICTVSRSLGKSPSRLLAVSSPTEEQKQLITALTAESKNC